MSCSPKPQLEAPKENSIVHVVDDEASVRASLNSLIRSAGYKVREYASATDFLQSNFPDLPGCLVLDVRLPGLSGLDLQRELVRAGIHIPIIFITGYGDIPMSVRAMKAGALEFLTKPFREQELLDAVQQAIERDLSFRRQWTELAELRHRFQSLTPRQRQVMQFVVSGLLNKQIAGELGTSEVTVKIQRAQVMQRMQASSLADLVRMAERLNRPANE